MPTTHARKSSGQHHARQPSLSAQTSPSKHRRDRTAPETPTLLRLPSSSSTGASQSPRSRQTTNPSTPTLTPTLTPTHASASASASASSATSPSYFSPQAAASGAEPRSPATRRPPASFSGHGIDTSRGPPITLITRGNSEIARRSSQKPSDFAFAQQQLQQLGFVSPGGSLRSADGPRQQRRDDREAAADSGESTPRRPPATGARNSNSVSASASTSTSDSSNARRARAGSTRSPRRQQYMARSTEGSSSYDSGMRSLSADTHAAHSGPGATDTSGTDGEPTEDVFLNIAADSAPRAGAMDNNTSRTDRLRSRIARASNRQSLPSSMYASSPAPSSSATPHASKIPASVDSKAGTPQRRASLLPSSSTPRSAREHTPASLATPLEAARSRHPERHPDLSPKPSFSAKKDSDLSPRDFLAQFSRRRQSHPDTAHTPPHRTGIYRPSNLHYSSSRDQPKTPQIETPQETASRADGTESHDSTGPASVWDELDGLKSRIRRIELGGNIPKTSGAAVSQATADRPRTANTSVTTVSSSPKQQRKANTSPSESTVGVQTPNNKIHPLLKEALAKTKQCVPPAVFRPLEAAANEALELAELTGSVGPQGSFHSHNGAAVPDRNARRKADHICRSLTEACIALCDTRSSLNSPALRSTAAENSRRPSLQVNGESPSVRQSIESESNRLSGNSPSRALNRIEARRASMLAGSLNGSPRESSQEPPAPSQSNMPSRFNRAGTSLHYNRRSVDQEDEEDDPIYRAPSRAMTDFHNSRSSQKNRFYTSQEPMPDLQPSPSIQPRMSLRRPTVTGVENENNMQFREGQGYNFDRQSSPAYENQVPRTQFSSNRHSIGGFSGLGRSGSLGRRYRGNTGGE